MQRDWVDKYGCKQERQFQEKIGLGLERNDLYFFYREEHEDSWCGSSGGGCHGALVTYLSGGVGPLVMTIFMVLAAETVNTAVEKPWTCIPKTITHWPKLPRM